jgi:hypothetical protein
MILDRSAGALCAFPFSFLFPLPHVMQLAHAGNSGRKQLAHAGKACSAGIVFFLIYLFTICTKKL